MTMASKAVKPNHAEPEVESRDPEAEDGPEVEDEEEEPAPSSRGGISKVEAVRRALAGGHELPEDGTDFIRRRFGIDVNRQHFSSTKSQLRKKERGETPASKAAGPAREKRKPPVEGYLAPPPKPRPGGEPDVLLALESVKDLVETYGVDKIKRIVDLLG